MPPDRGEAVWMLQGREVKMRAIKRPVNANDARPEGVRKMMILGEGVPIASSNARHVHRSITRDRIGIASDLRGVRCGRRAPREGPCDVKVSCIS